MAHSLGYTNAERQFHASRRMFAIIDGIIELAPEAADYSHTHWFEEMRWITSAEDPRFESIVRGYCRDGQIVAYRGSDFNGDVLVEEAMQTHASGLRRAFKLPADAPVFAGVKRETVGRAWETLRRLEL